MIDITGCEQIASDFEGSERKFAILYNGEPYMVKEPDPVRDKNNLLSYMNNTFSEHIGCKIFEMLDIPIQETFLAEYTRYDGKKEIVVVCKDFRTSGEQLYEADKFAKSLIESNRATKPDFTEIEKIFRKVEDKLLDDEDVEQRFWDVFVVDALIGNKDRHLGNWGFLSKDKIHLYLAPVYDCGSSLGALVEDNRIEECLEKEGVMSSCECNISLRFKINKKDCTYRDVLFNPPDKLKKSMRSIIPSIDIVEINNLVDSVEGLSKNRKEFIKKSVLMRYENILKISLNKLRKTEKQLNIGRSR